MSPRSGRHHDLLEAHEIALQDRLAVLQEHGDHLLEVGLQFIEGQPLAVGARKPGTWPTSSPVSGQRSITAEKVRTASTACGGSIVGRWPVVAERVRGAKASRGGCHSTSANPVTPPARIAHPRCQPDQTLPRMAA